VISYLTFLYFGVPADKVNKVNEHLHTRKVRLYLHQFINSELDVGQWTRRCSRYPWSTSRPIAMVHYTLLLEYIKLSGDQTVNVRINLNTEGLSPNHCCCGKALSTIYSQCVSVALIIQQAERMRPIVLSSAAYLAGQYFSTLSHKRHDFRENVNEHTMCASIVSTTLSQTFLIVRRIGRDIIKKTHWSSFKVSVTTRQISTKFTFFGRISKNTQIPNFMKISPIEAKLFHADRRTDAMTDRHGAANSCFSQICERA